MADTDERDRNLYRHGDLDPSGWEEAEMVTQRPNDMVKDKVVNTTFADRAKGRPSAETKVVEAEEAEDKAVTRRRPRKR